MSTGARDVSVKTFDVRDWRSRAERAEKVLRGIVADAREGSWRGVWIPEDRLREARACLQRQQAGEAK